MPPRTLTLFYDGLCPLCSREIEHYRRRAIPDSIAFIDITDGAFDARAHGLEAREVQRVMHVEQDGKVLAGLDAFVAIWDTIPCFGWLARLARVPLFNEMMRVGYVLFAAVRPWLPRRKRNACDTGVCHR